MPTQYWVLRNKLFPFFLKGEIYILHHLCLPYFWFHAINRHTKNLGTRWRWVVSFTPQSLYPQCKSPWYPMDKETRCIPELVWMWWQRSKFVFKIIIMHVQEFFQFQMRSWWDKNFKIRTSTSKYV